MSLTRDLDNLLKEMKELQKRLDAEEKRLITLRAEIEEVGRPLILSSPSVSLSSSSPSFPTVSSLSSFLTDSSTGSPTSISSLSSSSPSPFKLDTSPTNDELGLRRLFGTVSSKKFKSFSAAGSPGTITQLVARGVQDLHLTGARPSARGTRMVQSGQLRPTKRGGMAQRKSKSKPRKIKQRKTKSKVKKRKSKARRSSKKNHR